MNPQEIPPNVRDKLLKLYNSKKLTKLKLEINKLLKKYPQNLFLQNLLGGTYASLGEVENAIKIYESILKHIKNDPSVYNNTAVLYVKVKKYEEALQFYKKAIELDPNYIEAHFNLANLYRLHNMHNEAIECYKKIIAVNPENIDCYGRMGDFLMEIERYEDAIICYSIIINLSPELRQPYHNLVNCLKNSNKYEEALEISKMLVAKFPDYAEAYNSLGNICQDIEQYEEALDAYNKAIYLKPDFIDKVYYNIAKVYANMKNYEEAVRYNNLALDINVNDVQTHYNKALALYNLYRYNDALINYKKSLELKYNEIDTLTNYLKLGVPLDIKKNVLLDFSDQTMDFIDTKLELIVLLLIYYFQEKDTDNIEKYLGLAKIQIDANEHKKLNEVNQKFVLAYFNFIGKLYVKYKEAFQKSKSSSDLIYHIVESHSLAFAHQLINIGSRIYKVKPKIIFGTKAWHLGSCSMNHYKAFFKRHLESIPKNSKAIISFGEIDCRKDEGILFYCNKHNKNIDDIVKETVENYINYVNKELESKNIQGYYMGIPAPVIKSDSLDKNDKVRITIIQKFNNYLKKYLENSNLVFIDTYLITANEEGISNMEYMIDTTHLSPIILDKINKNFK